MYLKNVSRSDVGLPGGQLEPGAITEVDDSLTENRIVAAWIKAGVLQVVEGALIQSTTMADASSRFVEGVADQDEKDQLIDMLAERGIKRTRRTSLEKLRALAEG